MRHIRWPLAINSNSAGTFLIGRVRGINCRHRGATKRSTKRENGGSSTRPPNDVVDRRNYSKPIFRKQPEICSTNRDHDYDGRGNWLNRLHILKPQQNEATTRTPRIILSRSPSLFHKRSHKIRLGWPITSERTNERDRKGEHLEMGDFFLSLCIFYFFYFLRHHR